MTELEGNKFNTAFSNYNNYVNQNLDEQGILGVYDNYEFVWTLRRNLKRGNKHINLIQVLSVNFCHLIDYKKHNN